MVGCRQVSGVRCRWSPYAHDAHSWTLSVERRRSLSLLFSAAAAVVALLGACVLVLSIHALVTNPEARVSHPLLAPVLALVAAACTRFPLRLGTKDVIATLDSVPFVLAVAMLGTAEAVLVGVFGTIVAIWGQPLPGTGWRRWFWRAQIPLGTGLAMAATSEFAARALGIEPGEVLLLLPAFAVAVALELVFDILVVVELEANAPGESRHLLDSLVLPAANVFLPTAAAAMLTPYADQHVGYFMLLLPALLVGMYGALWVANSQQKEKRRGDRLKDTFSRYVPEGIVDDNIETMQEIELGGEQADLSVLFCDIRGFTSWSEDKGATEVITELNVLLTELSASVMETGGTLDKFTGDGLMAFWGAPVAVDDHAERASRAALDMLQRLEAVNARRQEEGNEPFAIGIAVHSGSAVVGNVGHERRLDYTAIGDTVNTTARLEASTKELGAVLLVSRATVDQLGEELRARAMLIGDVVMKGKARPVEAWALKPLRPELEGVDDEFAA